MNKLPNTTTAKSEDRVGPVLAAVCFGVLLLATVV